MATRRRPAVGTTLGRRTYMRVGAPYMYPPWWSPNSSSRFPRQAQSAHDPALGVRLLLSAVESGTLAIFGRDAPRLVAREQFRGTFESERSCMHETEVAH